VPFNEKYKDQFVINKNEDMVYAAAVGAAVMAMEKYVFETIIHHDFKYDLIGC
jgi:hypothetical protein